KNSGKIATQLIQGILNGNDYTALYSIIGTDLKEDIDVAISQKARQQGLYIIGANGTGKSTLLANLILTDIKQGLGVCLIEPHGDLTKTVLAGIPNHRLADLIYLLKVYRFDEPKHYLSCIFNELRLSRKDHGIYPESVLSHM